MSTFDRTCQSEPKLRDNMLQKPRSVCPLPASGRLQLSRMRLRTDQCVWVETRGAAVSFCPNALPWIFSFCWRKTRLYIWTWRFPPLFHAYVIIYEPMGFSALSPSLSCSTFVQAWCRLIYFKVDFWAPSIWQLNQIYFGGQLWF